MKNMLKKVRGFSKSKTGIAVAVIIVVVAGAWILIARSHKTTYQFVTVKQGTITEVVSVTGNVTTTRSVALGFENGGTIAAVYYNEGDHVNAGDVIARLDTQNLQAQLAQAQANVDAQTATLKNLQAGATLQNIAVSQTALASAKQTLDNSYASVPNTIAGAYASANDAVRNQLAAFFTNAELDNPQLIFPVNNSQIATDISSERLQASSELNTWQTEDQNIAIGAPSSTLDTMLQNTLGHLAVAKTLLTTASDAIVNANNLGTATAATYKTNVTTGLNEVNASIGNVNTLVQAIASEKSSVLQAEAQLNLTLAGTTQNNIDAQAAQVEQAQANAQAIQVNIDKAALISPMSGVVTVQNAKTGEIASPGAPVVSLIADNSLEVDADVPEVDIGKIATGDPVSMTLDAFPGETFTGKVFYVNPAETILSGVVDYLIKVSFDKNDPRMKSGLTANLDVTTQTKSGVLILPQYAVLQNDSGTFVETLQNNIMTQTPVTLGIEDQSGNVEIASGTTQGEQVINVGLK
jgi:HlyD family secretion protein